MFEGFDWGEAVRTSPVMLIILGCSVLTFGFALERLVYFGRRRGNPDAVLSGALERIRAGNLKEAAWVCATSPHPVGEVARQVVENPYLPAEAVEEKMHIALSEQKLQLERHLGWLGTMGSTAPLIGLLGTVWGIMRAFHDMALTGSAGPSVVAAGIAEALFTTAAGLLVAVPAVMLYNHFLRRINVMLTVAENHARSLRIALDQSRAESRARSNSAGETPRPETPAFAEAA